MMMRLGILSGALAGCLAVAGCAGNTASPLQTGAVSPVAGAAVRGTPVVAARPARVYIVVGFREKDCSALAPDVQITSPPTKGAVSFKPNQMTYVQHSTSGKCTGQKLAGTGVYYTANAGQSGTDTFTITARMATGEPATKTFNVRIAE